MTQTNRADARDVVRIRVQADRAEIEDLVDVVVGRLAEAGLVLVEHNTPISNELLSKCQDNWDLEFIKAEWLE